MSKINNLPEELIELIYRYVYQNCLDEIKIIKTCNNCNKIIKLSNDDINYCVSCNFPVCKDCWDTYCMNYYRGWKPFIKHCQQCAIFKMRDITYWLNN